VLSSFSELPAGASYIFRLDHGRRLVSRSGQFLPSFYSTNYLQVLYRSNRDFHILSRRVRPASARQSRLVGSSRCSFLWIGVCVLWGGGGLEGLLLWRWRPVRVQPRLKIADLKHLVLVGASAMIAGYVNSAWLAINSTLILDNMGT